MRDNTYDYMGYFKENPNGNTDARRHWPDTYKTVYHPTFSDESKYSGVVDRNYNPQGLTGGHWDGDDFVPADWQRQNGGSIDIKHPGRLTELKERTGKTEAELWATGNPDYRKMITFARNARKWKHDNGGHLHQSVDSDMQSPYIDENGMVYGQYYPEAWDALPQSRKDQVAASYALTQTAPAVVDESLKNQVLNAPIMPIRQG